MQRSRRGLTIIEVLVVAIILTVLVSVALPLYLQSVSDAEVNGCKTNMSSVATAVQARKTRVGGPYFSGVVNASAVAPGGPLSDLDNALPQCPGDPSAQYTVTALTEGFEVECSNPKHTFKWRGGFTSP